MKQKPIWPYPKGIRLGLAWFEDIATKEELETLKDYSQFRDYRLDFKRIIE